MIVTVWYFWLNPIQVTHKSGIPAENNYCADHCVPWDYGQQYFLTKLHHLSGCRLISRNIKTTCVTVYCSLLWQPSRSDLSGHGQGTWESVLWCQAQDIGSGTLCARGCGPPGFTASHECLTGLRSWEILGQVKAWGSFSCSSSLFWMAFICGVVEHKFCRVGTWHGSQESKFPLRVFHCNKVNNLLGQ